MFPVFRPARSVRLIPALAALLLAACATGPRPAVEPQPRPVPAPSTQPAPPAGGAPAPQALARPLQVASWADLPGWSADRHDEAWPAFLASCRALARQPVWQPVCEAARGLGERPGAATARAFFEARLAPWGVSNADGSREGLVTGYYEPLIKGSCSRSKAYAWPV
ncbi:MAG: MltA domain-containing protein, partial [Zoogloea sp.]|nr:MltA domain-containing protein [Zoogloea sp.]